MGDGLARLGEHLGRELGRHVPARRGWRRRRRAAPARPRPAAGGSRSSSEPVDPTRRHGGHPTQQPRPRTPGRRRPTLSCVLILLPPSETKTERTRGRPADPARLSFPELAAAARGRRPRARRGQRRRRRARPAGRQRQPHRRHRPQHPPGLLPRRRRRRPLHRGPVRRAGPRLARPRPRGAGRTAGWSSSPPCTARCARATRSRRTGCRWASTSARSARSPRSGASPWPRCSPRSPAAGVVVDCRSSTYAAAWAPRGPLAAAVGAGARARRDAHGQAHPRPGRAPPVRGGRRRAHPAGAAAGGGAGVRDHADPAAPARAALGPRRESCGDRRRSCSTWPSGSARS